MNTHVADLQGTTAAILHEIQGVMGLARHAWAAGLVRALFGTPTRRLANMLVSLDHDVEAYGLAAAAGNLLSNLVQEYRVECPQAIPWEGPLLVASNHPGAYDILMLAASLGRDDLKIISSDITIFRHLPSISPKFIPISQELHRRMAAFRAGLRHLLAGGALLLFPRGDVEIDPGLSPRALQGIDNWSASLELFLRRAQGTRLVVAIVGGVLSPRWFNHPLLRLWKKTEQRQKVAEIIQVAEQLVFSRNTPLTPWVSFSPALAFPQAGEKNRPSGELLGIVTQSARAQMARMVRK
jgi:hypothetical protein